MRTVWAVGTLLVSLAAASLSSQTISGTLLQSNSSGTIGGEIDSINTSKTTNGTARTWSIYNMTGGYGNSLQFWDYDTIGCAAGGMCNSRLTLTDNGNVGIGTTGPSGQLDVRSNGSGISSSGIRVTGSDYANYGGYLLFNRNSGNNTGAIIQSGDNSTYDSLAINPSGGNVGIGTTAPQQKLEINGNLRFTADGSVQTTAWTGVLCGGDYAEAMNTTGDKKLYQPGDVLVLASDGKGAVAKSAEAYSTLVAGIYATKPGVIGRRATLLKDADEVPMAMVGVVLTKVTTDNGPIRVGDLLVTSSIPGFAMKGTDRSRLVGAVIGKAMGSLDSATGVIEVLVTLQ